MPFPTVPITTPTSPSTTTVLLVAAHALMRAGLRAVLGSTPGFTVIAESTGIEDAVDIVEEGRPDVVLLEMAPSSLAEREALVRIREAVPEACVLFLGGDAPAGVGLRCLPSDAGLEDFCSVVGQVRNGACSGCAFRSVCPGPQVAVALSRRERQVAVSVASGMSSKQIASALGIGLRTVNTYRESLARKVGASSPAVLTRYVIEAGLE
jgi:DNA-binding NarL/FixJ family response regulator